MKLSFDEKTFISLLEVDRSSFNFDRLKNFAKKEKLLKKPKLHITIIGREAGEVIKKSVEKMSNSGELISKIKKVLYKTNWEYYPTGKTYIISKTYKEHGNEKRKSLVQFVKMPAMSGFYKKLNNILKLNLKIPIPHATLFTNSTKKKTRLRGIGIYSIKQFKSLNPKLIK